MHKRNVTANSKHKTIQRLGLEAKDLFRAKYFVFQLLYSFVEAIDYKAK
jgi:hypothetical protein